MLTCRSNEFGPSCQGLEELNGFSTARMPPKLRALGSNVRARTLVEAAGRPTGTLQTCSKQQALIDSSLLDILMACH